MPDPRSPLLVTHSAERILTQQVLTAREKVSPKTHSLVPRSNWALLTTLAVEILAGDPDGNDAQLLRDDPLFKTIAGIDPRGSV